MMLRWSGQVLEDWTSLLIAGEPGQHIVQRAVKFVLSSRMFAQWLVAPAMPQAIARAAEWEGISALGPNSRDDWSQDVAPVSASAPSVKKSRQSSPPARSGRPLLPHVPVLVQASMLAARGQHGWPHRDPRKSSICCWMPSAHALRAKRDSPTNDEAQGADDVNRFAQWQVDAMAGRRSATMGLARHEHQAKGLV